MSGENENNQDDLNAILANAERQLDAQLEKADRERALDLKMRQRFERNIQALKQYLPDIAAEFRHYKPKSMQIFCSPSGEANILEPTAGLPLYGDDPIAQCRAQVDRNIEKPLYTSIGFSKDDIQNESFIHIKYMNQIYDVYDEARQRLDPLTTIPEHLGSMIMFGIGLGYHFEPLLEKVTIDHLYICEPSADLFYASLFTCDWEHVLKTIDEKDGVIHLRIGVDYKRFTADFINQLKDQGSFNATNAVLYQHYPSEQIKQIIGEFSNDFHMVAIGWGFFDDGVISIAHDFANAQQNVPMLKHSIKIPRKWRSVPAILVANGPSIDETIEYIKEYKDDAVIFCCGTAINTLLANDIIPDFHVEVERTRFTVDLLEEFVDHDKMKQINLLTVNLMHPGIVKLFKWSGMGFKPAEPSTIISSEFIDKTKNFVRMSYCNPVVANTALSFACYMGFSEIYLFGVDNGYRSTGKIHSKQSYYYTEDGEEKTEISNIMRSSEFSVEGNFGGEVITTAFYNTGRHHLEHLLRLFKKEVNCYNCSDGAKIEHTFSVYPEDLLISPLGFDKQELVEYTKKEFFAQRSNDVDTYMQWLSINTFEDIVDEIISYTDKEFSSRGELATALKLQIRYLYSFSETRYRHLFFVLDGSLTYAHSIFRMAMYGLADEQEMLKVMHKMLALFHDYMREAKEKFARVLEEVDDVEFGMMDLFRKGHKKKGTESEA